jgi:LPS export ABC transporter protein LptC
MTHPTQDAAFLAQPHRRVKAASCVVLAALVFGAWTVLNNGDVPPETNEAGKHPIAVEADGARSIIVRKNGQKLWEFAAKKIEITADHSYATATGIEKGVLYKDGKPQWQLTAQNLKLDQRTNDVDARGGVSATGPNGLSVKTRRAVWKQQAERLVCPEVIDASMHGFKVSSGSASYESKTDELRCATSVTVTSSSATLKSPRAIAHPKQGIVSFEGGTDILIHKSALPQR